MSSSEVAGSNKQVSDFVHAINLVLPINACNAMITSTVYSMLLKVAIMGKYQ